MCGHVGKEKEKKKKKKREEQVHAAYWNSYKEKRKKEKGRKGRDANDSSKIARHTSGAKGKKKGVARKKGDRGLFDRRFLPEDLLEAGGKNFGEKKKRKRKEDWYGGSAIIFPLTAWVQYFLSIKEKGGPKKKRKGRERRRSRTMNLSPFSLQSSDDEMNDAEQKKKKKKYLKKKKKERKRKERGECWNAKLRLCLHFEKKKNGGKKK